MWGRGWMLVRAYHGDEVIGGHLLPDFVEEGAVVDAQGRGDAFAQAGPVFAVVGFGPFEDGGHAALHLWRGGGVLAGVFLLGGGVGLRRKNMLMRGQRMRRGRARRLGFA